MRPSNKQRTLSKKPSKKLRSLARPEKHPELPSSPHQEMEKSRDKSKKVQRKNTVKSSQENRVSIEPTTRYPYNFDSSILDSSSQQDQGIKQEFNPDQQLPALSDTSSKLLGFRTMPSPSRVKAFCSLEEQILVEKKKLKLVQKLAKKRNTRSLKEKQTRALYQKANQLLKAYPFSSPTAKYLLEELTRKIENNEGDLTPMEFQVFSGLLRKVRRKVSEFQEENKLILPPLAQFTQTHDLEPTRSPQYLVASARPQLGQIRPEQIAQVYQSNAMSFIQNEVNPPQIRYQVFLVPCVLAVQPSNSFELGRPRVKNDQ